MKEYLLIIASALALFNCSSPLSDLAISDPSLVYPNINIVIDNTDYGVGSSANVCLNDKNAAFIELKEGEVNINGLVTKYSLGCYSNNMAVKAGEKYEVEIVLADSTGYLSEVVVPAEFKKVKHPIKIKENESFEVNWEDNYTGISKVRFEIKDSTDHWITLFETDIPDNEVIIAEMNFPNYDITEGKLILSREKHGSMADGFGGGGINSKSSFSRLIKIQ